MSERIRNQEHSRGRENGHENNTHLQEVLKHKVEQAHADAEKHKGSLEHARKEAEKHAESTRPVETESHQTPPELHTFAGHQLLKSNAYKQVLKQTQKRLSKSSKMFSNVIHQKTIETVSEVGSKTAARPSGLLGGGIGAFIGSCALLYASKNLGFEYNFSLFIILFCMGFLAGISLEIVFRLFRKRS